MDDLEFRRKLFADPNCRDDYITKAIAADDAKRKFAEEMVGFDQQIKSALSVDIPEGLQEKLILRQTMAHHQSQKKRTRWQLGIAASVAFVIGMVGNNLLVTKAHQTLGDHALAHLYHEQPYFSSASFTPVSLSSLNQKMSEFDGKFNQAIGKLMVAGYCNFDGVRSLHLVYQGENDDVTVFIVPKTANLPLVKQFDDERFQGVISNYQNADVVIITDKKDSIKRWQSQVESQLEWSI